MHTKRILFMKIQYDNFREKKKLYIHNDNIKLVGMRIYCRNAFFSCVRE